MSRPDPLSAPVLLGAVLISSPALWRVLVDGTGAPGVAMVRLLVCLVLCWAALSAVAVLVGPPPRRTRAAAERAAGTADPDADGAVNGSEAADAAR